MNARRQGFALVLALTVVTLVGATTSLLVLYAGRMVQQQRHERARTYALVLLDSGIAYAESHKEQLAADLAARPDGTMSLPTNGLLPAGAKGDLTLQAVADGKVTIRATASLGSAQATEQISRKPPP